MKKNVLAIILAAGKGMRMKSNVPKVLHEVQGVPILERVLTGVQKAGARKTIVIVGHGEREVRSLIGKRAHAIHQQEQRGTGHAVLCARKKIAGWKGSVLVVPGDAPLVSTETFHSFIEEHTKSGALASVLTAVLEESADYGRILREGKRVVGIRETLDATPAESEITEINSGIYLFEAKELLDALGCLKAENTKGEYYLTDVIGFLAEKGRFVNGVVASSPDEIIGINSRMDLAVAEKILNTREIEKHQKNGVTIISPENTFIGPDTRIGKDTVIYPFSWIERNVTIGEACRIGPFATIRAASKIGDRAVIGCYVEIVRSVIGKNVRVKHLAYLGDAHIGENVNVGAGTVTANFDGAGKHVTVIEKGALIGSNTVLVAPVTVKKNAKTGAGSVVLKNLRIPEGSTVVGVPASVLIKKKKR